MVLLLPAASCLILGAASPRFARAGQPLPRHVALRLVEPTPAEASLGTTDREEDWPPLLKDPPPSMEWSDLALNVGLFVSLHAFFLTGAALAAGAPDGGTAASTAVGRGLGLAAFVALQQARGLPVAAWLGQDAQEAQRDPAPAALASPLAPVGAVALFGLLACMPALVASVAGAPETSSHFLPAARALPSPASAFDLLLAAPIEEELFFRAWLLAALRRCGLGDAAALGASCALFAAWHAGGGDGGPLFFAALGALLGGLYQRSGELWLPLATHALWNAAVVLGRTALL